MLVIQQVETAPQTHPLGVCGQEPSAQAVDGAHARAPGFDSVIRRAGHGVKPLAQLTGRVRVVGAQQQLLRCGQSPQ